MSIASINPSNGKTIQTYNAHTLEEVAEKVAATDKAWHTWKKSDHATRAALLKKMSGVLTERKQELAELMADEMGKPLTQGFSEVDKCIACCEYYALHGKDFLADQLIATEATKSFVSFQPLGVVLAVMPWNFPFWQVFRFLAPALAAGNCGILKHASNVSGCALAIESVVRQAGFPDNVFQTILISGSQVGSVIENPSIKAVTLTGSNNAGIDVARKAGAVLKKAVLELGGSDAYVVLADADLPLAADVCVKSRLINSGQSCIAAKRFIVEAPVAEAFTQLVLEKMQQMKLGDPRDLSTDVGPQARKDLRDQLHEQVTGSIAKGAGCLLGGTVTPGEHAYYPPTLLTGVLPGMPAYDEELFGPVASIIVAKDETDAIRIANDSEFGLGSAVFTRDAAKGERIAKYELDAGSSYVNARVISDPRLPFGGVKNSGYGRELGAFGIHEFVNIKTVYLK